LSPNSISCLLETGKYFCEQQEWAKAVTMFDAIIGNHDSTTPRLQLVEAYYQRALCNLHLGQLKNAEFDAGFVLMSYPIPWKVYLILAESQFQRKQYTNALRSCEGGLEVNAANENLIKLQDECWTELKLQRSQEKRGERGYLWKRGKKYRRRQPSGTSHSSH
jgi:tetratricopeptide (TPR) repeat protein